MTRHALPACPATILTLREAQARDLLVALRRTSDDLRMRTDGGRVWMHRVHHKLGTNVTPGDPMPLWGVVQLNPEEIPGTPGTNNEKRIEHIVDLQERLVGMGLSLNTRLTKELKREIGATVFETDPNEIPTIEEIRAAAPEERLRMIARLRLERDSLFEALRPIMALTTTLVHEFREGGAFKDDEAADAAVTELIATSQPFG